MRDYVVYTALFGNYDNLYEDFDVEPEIDYVCFTDQSNLKSNKWRLVYVNHDKHPGLNNHYLNRWYKMHPDMLFARYKASIYIDSNVCILGGISKFFEKYRGTLLSSPVHNLRVCIYDEALEVERLGKSDKQTLSKQMNFYRSEGFPEKFGLREMNVIYREHNDSRVIQLMRLWWQQINEYSERDQLSFMYSCWKLNFRPGCVFESTRFPNNNYLVKAHSGEFISYKERIKQLLIILFIKYLL